MNWDEKLVGDSIKLLKDGFSFKEIAESLNIEYGAVKRKLNGLGYKYSEYGGKPEVLLENHKRCLKCNNIKSSDQFNKKSENKDGLQKWCRECTKKKGQEYYNKTGGPHKDNIIKGNKRRRIKIRTKIYNYLLNNPCIDCGETHPAALDFDHRDNVEKLKNISEMSSYGWETIKTEINKCDVRCANCHRKRTATQFGWYGFLEE